MSTLDTLPATDVPTYVHCQPGETVSHTRPGDIILVRNKQWLGLFVRGIIRMRHRAPEERRYAYWTHAALVATRAGHLVEVNGRGVIISHVREYRDCHYHYVRLDLPETGRKAAVDFARSLLGQKYSIRNLLLLGVTIVLGDRLRMPDTGHGCVSLVAQALQRAGIHFDRKPTDMTPADLAMRFGVKP
jgi:hypothetical protein